MLRVCTGGCVKLKSQSYEKQSGEYGRVCKVEVREQCAWRVAWLWRIRWPKLESFTRWIHCLHASPAVLSFCCPSYSQVHSTSFSHSSSNISLCPSLSLSPCVLYHSWSPSCLPSLSLRLSVSFCPSLCLLLSVCPSLSIFFSAYPPYPPPPPSRYHSFSLTTSWSVSRSGTQQKEKYTSDSVTTRGPRAHEQNLTLTIRSGGGGGGGGG